MQFKIQFTHLGWISKIWQARGGNLTQMKTSFSPIWYQTKPPTNLKYKTIGLLSNYPTNAHNASTLNLRSRSRVLLSNKTKILFHDHINLELFPLIRQHSNWAGGEPNKALALGAYNLFLPTKILTLSPTWLGKFYRSSLEIFFLFNIILNISLHIHLDF